jgi:hypothetical protein
MTSKPKSWRDLLPVHRATELFPMMSEEELRALGEDIKKNGLLEAVALLDGKLLDGRNRLEAMEAVGIKLTSGNGQRIEWEKIPFRKVKGTDPIAFVISKNIHRRHLTVEQKRDLVARLLKAAPEKSDRQIAESIHVDHKTVASVRAKQEARGEIPHVETRTDTKGRRQQAHRTGPAISRKFPRNPAVTAAADRAEPAQPQPAPKSAAEPDELVKLRADLADEKMIRDQALSGWRRALEAHDGYWTRKQFEDVRFCLHPDTYDQADPERRKTAWNLINMRKLLLLKKSEREEELPRPSRITVNDLMALQRQKDAERKAKRAARRKKPSAPPPPPPPAIEERVQHQPAGEIIADTPDRRAVP